MKPSSFGTTSELAFINADETPAILTEKKMKIDWVNTLFLTLSPIAAVILCWSFFKGHGMDYGQLGMAVFFYFLTGLSITAGYHRMLSHRAYNAHPIVKFVLLVFGAAAFQNSALKWCADHRIHHRHVDHDKDPYNINKGFFHAHIGWIFFKEQDKDPQYPKDLMNDKLVMWQHKYYLAIAVVAGMVLPAVLGHFLFGSALGGFALSGIARIVFVHHCTFFINSLAHMVGTRPYTEENTARDSGIIAIFSYGEGYHNYHHIFPTDYRNGIRWFHFDPTKWLVKSLSYVGLTYDLKKVPEKLITQAKLETKRLKASM
jgi:stearoyl-CoA desaturase (Delta-9 desaturase)